MSIRSISSKSVEWFHITDISSEDASELKKKFSFHPLTLKDTLSPSENPKIDTFPNYIFGIFHLPEVRKQEKKILMHELNVYIGDGYVITIGDASFRALRNLYYTVARTPAMRKEFMSGNSNALFYNILHRLFIDAFDPALQYVGNSIRDIEHQVYEESANKDALIFIATIRRNLLNLKRIIEPQLPIIHSLAIMDNKIISREFTEYFDDIDDYAERVSVLLKNQINILEGLHATNESLIQYRTNQVIKALTIVSVAILPLTLFSGIYGMNISLPFTNNPHLIWALFFSLIVISGLLIYWIVKRDH